MLLKYIFKKIYLYEQMNNPNFVKSVVKTSHDKYVMVKAINSFYFLF